MVNCKLIVVLCVLTVVWGRNTIAQQQNRPLRMAVAGVTHGHSSWIFGSKKTADVDIVGISEKDAVVLRKFADKYAVPERLLYADLEQMLDVVRPEAVVAFGSIYNHMLVVEACAKRNIHVMVEKPLATNIQHAKKIKKLADETGIHVLTNYETSWYPTTAKAIDFVNEGSIGTLRKAVMHHGHRGPKGFVADEFLSWLTDPILNGGGALIDFGCYGANIMTNLMKGLRPVSVTAITRQFKPQDYPDVDDEATIVVDYTSAQCIIQASWNWPFGRKDMELYGESGFIVCMDNSNMRMRQQGKQEEVLQIGRDETGTYENPFSYFKGVIRGDITPDPHSLYTLENNLLTVEILDAARRSAKSGKRIYLD